MTLPRGWAWITIEDTGQYINGFAFKPQHWGSEGKPIIRIQNLTNPGKHLNRTTIEVPAAVQVATGEMLVSWSATLDVFYWRREPALLNQHIFRVVPRVGLVEPRLLYYWLKVAIQQLCDSPDLHGSTMAHINRGPFLAHRIPLPPFAEQSRLADRLDELLTELDDGVAELAAAQAKLTQYRQSLLKAAVEGDLTAEWRAENPPQETGAELLARILRERRARWEARQLERFGMQGKSPPSGWRERYSEPVGPAAADLPELPTSWAWATLDQLLSELRSGTAETSGRQPTGYPVLKSSAVRQGSIDFQALNYLEPAQSERQENYVERGDILITRLSGSVEYVGCCAVVSKLPVFRVQYPDRVFCGKPALGDASLAALVAMSFQAPLIRTMVETAAKSTAGHKRISLSDLYPLPIALPPPDELASIMDAVESASATVESAVRSVDTGLRMAAAQRQNILRAAFSGQLVAQDPNDEPASVLLARIRAERGAAAAQPAAGRGRKAKIAA